MPADDGAVEALRREAEVSCPPPPKDYTPCAISQSYCLFNVTADPCEFDNLAFKLPSVVGMLKDTMEKFRSTAVPRGNKPIDPRYNQIKTYDNPKRWKKFDYRLTQPFPKNNRSVVIFDLPLCSQRNKLIN